MPPAPTPDSRRLRIHTLWAIAFGAAAVAICYEWVDRPMAFAVERNGLNKIAFFKLLTDPPPLIERFCPLALVLLALHRVRSAWVRWELTLFTACLCLIVADECRESIGDLCGRYWPDTWFNNNPSLLGTGAYGFHPFHGGDDVGSFPSGHAARVFGFAAVWWIVAPRGRWICLLICPPLVLSLLAMNYHFVGDVVGGTMIGAIVAAWGATLAGLRARPCSVPSAI